MDKRNTQRLRCSLDVLVCTTLEARPAQIVNVSALGAKLRMDEPFAPGARIHLDLDGDFYWGTVVWAEVDRMGVHFRAPAASGALRAHVQRLQSALAIATRTSSPTERRSLPAASFGRRTTSGGR